MGRLIFPRKRKKTDSRREGGRPFFCRIVFYADGICPHPAAFTGAFRIISQQNTPSKTAVPKNKRVRQ